MRLFKLELRKLVKSPAILGFIAFCLFANVLTVFKTSHKKEIDYLNDIAAVTGTVYNEEYAARIQEITDPGQSGYNPPYDLLFKELLISAAQSKNVFADMNGGAEIMKWLAKKDNPLPSITKSILRWKYAKLAPILLEKGKQGDGDSVYFSLATRRIHATIFGTIGKLLASECCVFFLLIMLWALGYEHMAGSGLVAYSTKTGRKLTLYKIGAALLIGTAFFILFYSLTYGLTFAVNDYSIVWRQNISAQYHQLTDFDANTPFVTWAPMTIGGYFWGTVGVAFLNCLVVALFVIPLGLMIKNVYVAFCSAAGIVFLNYLVFVLGMRIGQGIPFWWHLSMLTPLNQIISIGMWFSDGAQIMLLPHFELVYPLICIALLSPVIAICAKMFSRKELT